MTEPVIASSGNVFAGLGFDPGEAAILPMRARLLADLRQPDSVARFSSVYGAPQVHR